MQGEVYHAFETLSVAGSAVGFTAATYGAATLARVHVATARVRYRMDGTNPTASVGEPLEIGSIIELDSADQVQRIRFISMDGGTASLSCHFGKK